VTDPWRELLEPGAIGLLTKQFTAMAPVHRWLVEQMP